MQFEELEDTIKQYLLLADKGVVKLLCATILANRIPQLDPTWLFLVSNSGGGKSELLSALSYADGCFEIDDLTTKTFISGARAGSKETSLLFRLPRDPVMVFKDLTNMLEKDRKEMGTIFSQLRLIYDGKLNKSFGTGEDVVTKIKVGLIAGVTIAIEDFNANQASMGQRSIRYYMDQPDAKEVTKWGIKNKKNKEMRQIMGEAFKAYIDGNQWDLKQELSDLPEKVESDIVDLAEMATLARSDVKRREYDREQRIERSGLREMPLRFAKQLANLGRAMIFMNKGTLTGLDSRILYKVALDSIPPERRKIMIAGTKFEEMTLEGIATETRLGEESSKIYLGDLVNLGVIIRSKGFGSKFAYRLQPAYRAIISKFENIEMTNAVLDQEDELTLPAAPESEFENNARKVGLIP